MNVKQRKTLIRTATGLEKADLAILNGTLVNVYTGELLPGWGIAVKDDRIASVGKEIGPALGPRTEIIDATDKFVVPGFIDSHAHLNLYATLGEFLRYIMVGGTTTIVTELIEISFPLGYRGILAYLESCKSQPAKVFGMIPPMLTISPASRPESFNLEQFRNLMQRDDVLGLGEVYWLPVLEEDGKILELMEETAIAGKIVAGHSAGAKGAKLAAYIASGITSCHEPITAEEVAERLRLGIYVLAREGETRQDLKDIALIKDMELDLRHLVLVTDGIFPERLVEKGYMEAVLQRAVDLGFDPVTAIQMATINPARYLKIDDRVGGIAPGKYADIVIIPDLYKIKADYVISNGRVIVRHGQLLVTPQQYTFPAWANMAVRLPKQYGPDDFAISVPAGLDHVNVRLIDQVEELVTQEAIATVAVSQGVIEADPASDLLKVACIDFQANPGKQFVGLVKGFKLKKGAIATSMAWDVTNIVVVGAVDADMALAVNRVADLHGGAVVCADGQVIAEIPLPIGGSMSDAPMEELLRRSKEFQQATCALGAPFANTHLTMMTLTSPAIPFIRVCEDGLYNIRNGSRIELLSL